jgi:predicted DNA-binding protein (UPF0251 family)
MGRPRKDRLVAFNPKISYFKPRGIPMVDLSEVHLTVDEREALRLADLDGLSHEDSGQCMGVSRATFGRILHKARQTVADALINGKAIKVDGGNYKMIEETRRFSCRKCQHQWDEPLGTGRPEVCPACGQDDFYRFLDG